VTSNTIEAVAADGKRMTLAELKTFLAELDSAGAPADAGLSARVSFGGGLKSLKAVLTR
jgi:hypothetical protein